MGSTNTYSAHDGVPIQVDDDSSILMAYPNGPGTQRIVKYKFKNHEAAEDALMLLATRKASLADYTDNKIDE
jgi:hypothetical protein